MENCRLRILRPKIGTGHASSPSWGSCSMALAEHCAGLEQRLQILDEFPRKRISDHGHADRPYGRSRRRNTEFREDRLTYRDDLADFRDDLADFS
jgi:hypothetical protein